jgi:Lon protease-like protein
MIMESMFELPLFPLNTVLFPGMPLRLHIFEERYKLMISNCIRQSQPFGVVLIKEGVEALGPLARPHTVGCTARIASMEQLEDGRMNIMAIGRERFRIVSLDRELPYLVGKVERYPLHDGDPVAQEDAARRLRPWITNYMDLLSALDDIELNAEQLPDDPVALALVAATLLQVPQKQKQGLLATGSVVDILTTMRALYRREVAFVKEMVAQEVEDQGSFSLN